MSNNEGLNESIRAAIKAYVAETYATCKIEIVSTYQISNWRWRHWGTWITRIATQEALDSLCICLKTLTPEELHHIHKYLPRPAWDKLGLELPGKLKYDLEKIGQINDPNILEWLRVSVSDKQCASSTPGPTACIQLCGQFGIPDYKTRFCEVGYHKTNPEYLKMFQAILKAQLPPLKHNVVLLSVEEREHVKYVLECDQTDSEACMKAKFGCSRCWKIHIRIFGKSACFLTNSQGSTLRKKTLDALEDVLDKQEGLLPPHNVVQFGQKAYDNWVWWLALSDADQRNKCPYNHGMWMSRTKEDCLKYCDPVFLERNDACPCSRYSPEITRTVIEKCIALGPKEELPPHCDDALEQEKYDALRAWRDDTTKNRHQNCVRDYSENEPCWGYEDCKGIFISLVSSCPRCHIITGEPVPNGDSGPCTTYSDEAVCAVVDKILAKGPKFVEFPIWSKVTGERYIITSQDKFKWYYTGGWATRNGGCYTTTQPEKPFVEYPIWYVGGPADGEMRTITAEKDGKLWAGIIPCIDKGKTDCYTTTPPKKEEFEPYLVVKIDGPGRNGDVYNLVARKDANSFYDDTGGYHFKWDVLKINNPTKLHKMLHKLDGESGIVEAIMATIKKEGY